MISRRLFVRVAAVGASGVVLSSRGAAQDPRRRVALADTSNLFAMDQGAARSVRLPPKPNARPSMAPGERDALEHRLRCQCGCTLDVYTCRTTDFTCQVSPQMHRDVLALVDGGYTTQEILDAFVENYGEQVLMAPPKSGFNLLAYALPGSLMAIGAIVLAVLIKSWRRPAPVADDVARRVAPTGTPEEMAELEAAVRDDS